MVPVTWILLSTPINSYGGAGGRGGGENRLQIKTEGVIFILCFVFNLYLYFKYFLVFEA